MNRNKIVFISVFLIFLVIISISFLISFSNDRKRKEKINNMKEEVLNYLNDKYSEQFNIIDYSYERNTYNVQTEDDYVTMEMNSSYIYTFNVSSSRLVEFDVIYVVYEDESEYINNKKYNIIEEGIYENYIYEYKIREIRNEIKSSVFDIISDSKSLDISIDNLILSSDNTLIDYSLDNEERKKLYDEYRKLDKSVSVIDYFNFCLDIDNNVSFVLNIDINRTINKNNISDFKDEVRDLVIYLTNLGYSNYDINFTFNNFQSARATEYFDNGYEQIYLIFDYENYSNIEESERVDVYIIDK